MSKIGIVFTPMHNFKGLTEALWSAKSSKYDLVTYIQPQWIEPRPPLAKAWNNGAAQAFAGGCDFALVCNDDILFAPQTIDNMVAEYKRLRKSENVIMVTPNNIYGQLQDPYDILHYGVTAEPTWSESPNFSCFLIAPEFFNIVGTFDENFVPAWFEDNDAHRRAQLLGYKLITTTAAPQVHFGGVSTSMMQSPDSSISKHYYIRKWGGLPYSHPVPDELKEHFEQPYNDTNLTPKDWEPNR